MYLKSKRRWSHETQKYRAVAVGYLPAKQRPEDRGKAGSAARAVASAVAAAAGDVRRTVP